MSQQPDSIDRMRIATPCHVGWENMTGDDRTRFCEQCSLHVYNISEMTSEEVRSLISKAEGRVCARLYRRADGTVLTRDCPVGLRALRKRISRRAGAVLTAIFSVCSVVLSQKGNQERKSDTRSAVLKTERTTVNDAQSVLTGVVVDETGAVFTGVKITLTNEGSNESVSAISTDTGEFTISGLSAGTYALEIEGPGLTRHKQTDFRINSRELVRVEATVRFDVTTTVLVGMVDNSSETEANGINVISGETIRRLPLN